MMIRETEEKKAKEEREGRMTEENDHKERGDKERREGEDATVNER